MTLRRVRVAQLLAIAVVLIAAAYPSVAAATTSYSAGTPSVDGVIDGPWNTSQGDASAGNPYQMSDLFPTYTPGGSTTILGGPTEPNLAVYPAASAAVPYPSGVAGTPGPLDGYCSSLGANPETGSPVPEPSGLDLPFAPYYFPDVVGNSDGSLTILWHGSEVPPGQSYSGDPTQCNDCHAQATNNDSVNSWPMLSSF